jgi:hypothetical protein
MWEVANLLAYGRSTLLASPENGRCYPDAKETDSIAAIVLERSIPDERL